MLKNKNPSRTSVILSVLIIIVLGYALNIMFTNGSLSPTGTSTQVTNVPYTPITLSLNDWQNFSAKANQFKRDVTFLYPKELTTSGGDGGDSFFTITFDDKNKNSPAWTTPFTGSSTVMTLRGAVLLMRVSTAYPRVPESKLLYDYLSFYPFTEIYSKPIILDGKNGVTIKREVTLSTGEKRFEYWAIFKNVDGSAYEFMMRGDIYTNSDDVFTQLLQTLKWGAKPVE